MTSLRNAIRWMVELFSFGCGFCGGYYVHRADCPVTKWNNGNPFK